MTMTMRQISISMDGTWAGSGELNADGVIENCGAQFCDDNDESLRIYDQIEAAISEGQEQLWITTDDGEDHKVEWSITEDAEEETAG